MKTYSAQVVHEYDNGDALLEFPDDMMEELGWKAGDTLDISLEGTKIIIKNLTKDASST